ncbi:MAG: ABC transporter permease subunit [Deltaproteobacteria bacterium]|nr:ABC transporter permease subunit [Deltaproteobacteria bacterium]
MILDRRPWMGRLARDSSAMFGLALVVALVLFALLGPLLLSAEPNASDFAAPRSAVGGPPGPSAAHWLGTDPLYRDLLARLAHGARLSLLIAAAATLLAIGVGTAIGVTAGYLEGTRYRRVDDLLMRLVDVALAFPYLLLVTAIGVAIDRADAFTVIAILGLTSWTGVARVVRAKTLQIKTRDYITASRALGASGWMTVRRHILPGISSTLLIIGSHAVAQMILAEAVLGYLTVGIEPPHPTWGRMLHEGEHYLGLQPLLVAAPGIAILLSVLGFTRLGDGLRDALADRGAPTAPQGRWRFAVDGVVLAAAVLLVGFAQPEQLAGPELGTPVSTGASTPRRGGTLRVATMVAVHHLDPALAYDEASRAINDLIFARLVTWDPQGAVVGELCESFEVLDQATRFRFDLRAGLRFHDGEPLSAADVKRSLERTLHPATPSPAASFYRHIKGFEAYRGGKAAGLDGVKVTGPLQVEISLDGPDATFLSLLGMGFAAPVCPSSGSQVNPKQPAPPCGAGPFMIDVTEAGERIRLKRFDGYHEAGKPYLDGVEWLLSVPPHTQRYRFEAGELDFVADLTGVDTGRFAADERWANHRAWTTQPATHGIFLNTEMPPLDNRHLRRAIAFAVDGSVLSKVRATVSETTRIIPASIPGPPRDRPMRRHDVAQALREMELAGYPYDPQTGRGGLPEPIDYVTVPDTFEQSAGEVFQQQLARVGIPIRLRLVSWATWLTLISKRHTVAMGWRGWGADYPDPANFFEPLLTTAAIQDEGSQNVSFFSHAELDRVVAAAHGESDLHKRMALYEQAETIVRDEAPWIPVYANRVLQVWQPYVRGYRPHPVEWMRLRDVWLDHGADEASAVGGTGGGAE